MSAYRILFFLFIGCLTLNCLAEAPAFTVTEGVLGACKIKLAVPVKWNGQVLLLAH